MKRDLVVLYALAAAGLVAAIIGAAAVAGEDSLRLQVPYFASGVMGGLGMFGFGLAIAMIQRGRHDAAAERDQVNALLRESADWLATVRGGGVR